MEENSIDIDSLPGYRFIHLDSGGDVIIIFVAAPLNPQEISDIQDCAHEAGLGGTVVPVWRIASGQYAYDAPEQWRTLLDTMDWEYATSRTFGKLTCSPEPYAWRLEPSDSEEPPTEP